jgi:hypothetical protein
LLGEIGAGDYEYVISSIARLLNKAGQDSTTKLPKKVCYIVNFEIQISSQKGFEVSNIKRVRGR